MKKRVSLLLLTCALFAGSRLPAQLSNTICIAGSVVSSVPMMKAALSSRGEHTWMFNDTLTDCDTPYEVVVVVNPWGNAAVISWDIPLDGLPPGYEYAISESQEPPLQGIIFHQADTTVTGLVPNTRYFLHVRTNCSSGSSPWVTEAFYTSIMPPPANDDPLGAIELTVFPDGCLQQTLCSTLMATRSAIRPLPVCGDTAGVDDDIWYKFKPAAGQFFVSVEFEFVGGDIFGPAAQIYTTSDNTANGVFFLYSCSNDEGPGDMPGFYSMPVIPGTTYFVRVFTNHTGVDEQFKICAKKTLLINDNADGAIMINVDEGCQGARFTNAGATQSFGEPSGSCSSLTGYATAWYSFKAPRGGAVRVSTAGSVGNTLRDTRLALFSATDINDYSTFSIIACDEDGGAGENDKMSVIYATGLTPDMTYYIEVDKANAGTADGSFCLAVETLRTDMLSTTNNCSSEYQTPVGSIPTYTGWVPLMDDESKLVALAKSQSGAPVDAYVFSQNVFNGSNRKDPVSGEFYLNRNFAVDNTVNNLSLTSQLFFPNSELIALNIADGAASLGTLRVTRQASSVCEPDFEASKGTNTELAQIGSGWCNGINWLSVTSSGYSNFYIHAAKAYFSGKIFLQGAYDSTIGRHKDVTGQWSNVLNTYAKNQPYSLTNYEGFGAATSGGKGQPVYHVTNLSPNGPGSLVEALGSNRTVVFDIAGTITNFHWEGYNIHNLTIDGYSAPSPGITLDVFGNGDGLSFLYGCHDIIVRNIRVRNAGNDGINVVGSHDIVFDHVSSANNGDGDLDITEGSYNISVQWSIFGHAANGAMLIAYPGTKAVSVHHNLFNSSGPGRGERNPFVHNASNFTPNPVDYLMADFRNNIVWKWGKADGSDYGFGSEADYGGTLQAVNNFYQSIYFPNEAITKNRESTGAKVYASGNVSGNIGVDPNAISNVSLPWVTPVMTTETPGLASAKILVQAGARPLDSLDQVLVNSVSLANCPEAPAVLLGTQPGSESVPEGFFKSSSETTDILDWVLVEIKNSGGVLLSRRAAFVREDGRIVDLDGVSPIAMNGLNSGLAYITVRHRNHLGLSTQNPILFVSRSLGVSVASVVSFDFTTASDANIFGDANAFKVIDGKNVMIGGNANGNLNVRYGGLSSDVSAISVYIGNLTGVITRVYMPMDVNFDGVVRFGGLGNDVGWLQNKALSGVITAVVSEQVR